MSRLSISNLTLPYRWLILGLEFSESYAEFHTKERPLCAIVKPYVQSPPEAPNTVCLRNTYEVRATILSVTPAAEDRLLLHSPVDVVSENDLAGESNDGEDNKGKVQGRE